MKSPSFKWVGIDLFIYDFFCKSSVVHLDEPNEESPVQQD